MKTQPDQRRTFGNYCEKRVDDWLATLGWQPTVKNMLYPGGEVDRIYSKHSFSCTRHCLVEIKGAIVSSRDDALALLWEWGLRRFVKRRQLKRLLTVYQHWQRQTVFSSEHPLLTQFFDFRLMIVLVFQKCEPDLELENQYRKNGFRYFRIGKNTAILSLQPDVTPLRNSRAMLQIEH